MDVIGLCEELQSELNGRKGFINNQVDIAKCRALIARILECLPFFIRDAENVVSNRNSILWNADTVAKNVLKEAEDRALQMVADSVIIRRAEDEGKEIIDEAYRECDNLVLTTKRHLDDILKETENFLRTALQTISSNRYELKNIIINAGAKSK